jgi:hypothetical protein
MTSILGGAVFQHQIDGWELSWESAGPYRHWCRLTRPGHRETILVEMKNPGSLSRDGSNLRKDTTLRILRVVGEQASVNWLVVNLFDFAAAKPAELHENWPARDAGALVFDKLNLHELQFALFAHGDVPRDYKTDYEGRIATIRAAFQSLPRIATPTTKTGQPGHPTNWQRQLRIPEVVSAILLAKRGA